MHRGSNCLWPETQETAQNEQKVHGFPVKTPFCHIVSTCQSQLQRGLKKGRPKPQFFAKNIRILLSFFHFRSKAFNVCFAKHHLQPCGGSSSRLGTAQVPLHALQAPKPHSIKGRAQMNGCWQSNMAVLESHLNKKVEQLIIVLSLSLERARRTLAPNPGKLLDESSKFAHTRVPTLEASQLLRSMRLRSHYV